MGVSYTPPPSTGGGAAEGEVIPTAVPGTTETVTPNPYSDLNLAGYDWFKVTADPDGDWGDEVVYAYGRTGDTHPRVVWVGTGSVYFGDGTSNPMDDADYLDLLAVQKLNAISPASINAAGGTWSASAAVTATDSSDASASLQADDGLGLFGGVLVAVGAAATVGDVDVRIAVSTGDVVFATDDGGTPKLGFFGTAPAARPTGVAVTAAGVHAALVSLGLITA